jgi:hypothetical protein
MVRVRVGLWAKIKIASGGPSAERDARAGCGFVV